MLIVTSAAADPTLLTIDEVAEAIGRPAVNLVILQRLNARVSELLAGACNLERAGAAILTLREEAYTETIRPQCPVDVLYLSRKPILAVSAVTEGSTNLTEADFEITSDRGLLRLSSGCPAWWSAEKIVVSFRAGYTTVPPALKELAAKLAASLHAERGRDPSLGSVEIPGVITETFRYGKPDDPLISAEIMEGLAAGGFVYKQSMIL